MIRHAESPPSGHDRLVPVAATVVAVAYLLSLVLPGLLPAVTVAACIAACALVLTLRRSRGLRWLLPALAVWLAIGVGGALLLSTELLRGPAWIATVLFLLPLPLIPWLYARTFEVADGGAPPATSPDSPAAAEAAASDDGAPAPEQESAR